jgi:hypothetical protein
MHLVREWIYFISLDASASNFFHREPERTISLKAFVSKVFQNFVDAFPRFAHRFGSLDRFEPAKAFLREEGGPRSGGRSLRDIVIWLNFTVTRSPSVAYDASSLPEGAYLCETVEMFTKLWYNEVAINNPFKGRYL